jgi:phospholipase/carboxylesterase
MSQPQIERAARAHRQARLTARPGPGPFSAIKPGEHVLPGSETLLLVPASYSAQTPSPLLIMLHGAGGRADHALGMVRQPAEGRGVIVLAPQAGAQTWDVLRGGYGADVARIDRALSSAFAMFNINGARLGVGGFSDGASYALCLGLANGDLFGDVLAFSPGFAAPPAVRGEPRVFISHGVDDRVLPIGSCGRPLAAKLADAGYDVDYREFEGRHLVPAEMVEAAVERFVS